MRRRTLRGIQHYNENWFRSCFYHQMIAATGYFGSPPEYIVCNSRMEVLPGPKFADFQIKWRDILDDEALGRLCGVTIQRKDRTDDLLEDIVGNINANRPLIVAQDNYYLDYRWDYYLKAHNAHFVLVYGYDLDERTITIGENNFIKSYDFAEKIIPFGDVKRAYTSYLDLFLREDGSSLISFQRGSAAESGERERLLRMQRRAFTRGGYDQYTALYRSLLTNSVTNEELQQQNLIVSALTQYFRILMDQAASLGAGEALLARLKEIWRCAVFLQGIYMKAFWRWNPDLIQTPKFGERTEFLIHALSEAERELAELDR